MSVKRGDVVRYSAFGRTVNAIVLSTRSGEVSHLGADDQPLATLAFIDDGRETGLTKDKDGNVIWPAGRTPQVFIEHDVVHASHEFSAQFKQDNGLTTPAQIASVRGHGEYSEVAVTEIADVEDVPEETVAADPVQPGVNAKSVPAAGPVAVPPTPTPDATA